MSIEAAAIGSKAKLGCGAGAAYGAGNSDRFRGLAFCAGCALYQFIPGYSDLFLPQGAKINGNEFTPSRRAGASEIPSVRDNPPARRHQSVADGHLGNSVF